eukprot:TRINITY_DN1221_c0_g1_i1.p2 TRINITY_DN1221_c0_g1~~TRINITY_DN1221_c0_g1_i1.p2  ORF type:complete len:189 (+),score=18.83 TRINITY_DN1221_c0_g1_i1:217-783(+)
MNFATLVTLLAIAATVSAQSYDCCTASSSRRRRNYSNCYVHSGSCGAFTDESDCWQYYAPYAGTYCIAESDSDCCDANAGAIAGLCVGIAVVIAIAVVCCCAFCPSCPWAKSRLAKNNPQQQAVTHTVVAQQGHPPMQQQPVAVAQPMYVATQPAPQYTQPAPQYSQQPQYAPQQPAGGVSKTDTGQM